MRRAWFVCGSGALLACVLAGCQTKSEPPGAAVKTPAAAAKAIPEAKVGGAPELAALVDSHQGKVVLVDFWATWCSPCVEKFPHTVALAEKYRKEGLVAISVSLDDPDGLEQVQKFLTSQGADFEHLVSKDGGSSESMEAFQLDAAVPHYRLYDRTGKVRYDWDSLPSDIEKTVESLLAEGASG